MRIPEGWEDKWKKFLYEGMSAEAIGAKELSKVFDFFHISEHKLSKDDFFTFTPRRPRFPFSDVDGNVTEDNFTKRISVAPTVIDALDALGENSLDSVYGWGHLYAGFGEPDTEAKTDGCPETDDMKYDVEFNMKNWLKTKLARGEIKPPGNSFVKNWLDSKSKIGRKLSPSTLPLDLTNEFEFCVPDANETEEQWLLKPTKLIYLGEVEAETGDVLLSSAGLQAIKEAGLEPHSY